MKVGNHRHIRRWLQKLVAVQIAHPLATLVFWVALAAVSVAVTIGYLGFETSQRSLISPSDRMMQLLKMADRFSSRRPS